MNLEDIRSKAQPILRRYGVERAAVFGSYARGDYNEHSDLDLLIYYSPNAKNTLFTHARLKNELQQLFRKKVDVVTEKAISPYLRDIILKDMRYIL